MTISKNGLNILKQLEGGPVLKAYRDGDSYSIGYGHYGVDADTVITEQQAESLLLQDVQSAQRAIDGMSLDLTQNQYDALVILVYNIGATAFQYSTLRALIKNDATPREALRKQWLSWNKSRVNGVLTENSGLTKRRNKEWALYCSGEASSWKMTAAATLLLLVLVILVII